MNIFKNMEVLFIGPSCQYITKYVHDFWELSVEIRKDLGERGYYLDQYLSEVIEALARIDLVTAGEITNDVCWDVLADCYILCGTEEKKVNFLMYLKTILKIIIRILLIGTRRHNFMQVIFQSVFT